MRFSFVDRLLQFSDPKQLQGVKWVTGDEHYLVSSACGKERVLMPTLVGEAVGQLAAWYAMHHSHFRLRPVAGVVSAVDVCGEVGLGELLRLEASIDALDDKAVHYQGAAWVGQRCVLRIHDAIGPMIPLDSLSDPYLTQQQCQALLVGLDNALIDDALLTQGWGEPVATCLPPNYAGGTYDRHGPFSIGEPLIGVKLVSASALYFADHFPKQPVLPMTLLMQCNHHLASTYLKRAYPHSDYRLFQASRIKMNQFVPPGAILTTVCQPKAHNSFVLRSSVNGKRVAVMQLHYREGTHG